MMAAMRVTSSAVLVAALVSCSASRPGLELARSGQPVMGTILTVTVAARDRAVAQALADDAVAEARRWDDALTIWRPEGELARFNERAGTGWIDVSPRLARGLEAMLSLAQATGGAFDPAVGALTDGRKRGPVAAAGRVLLVQSTRARLESKSALDPGAIGKGLALDAIVERMRARGVTSAFLDFGGSSQSAIGSPPDDDRGWPVLVAGWAAGTSHGIVRLRDASISTSRAGATDTTPIFDPRTGVVVAAPRLATVVARTATEADAWSTALVVLGTEGMEAAARRGVESLVEEKGGVVVSSGFRLEPVAPRR
jgi:FAD:protein FMN transferase